MNTQEYNGYTNWETWNVCLWLQNDEGIYKEAKRFRRFHSNTELDGEWVVGGQDAKRIVSGVGGVMQDGTPDFDNAAQFEEVNWQQVAECINSL